MQLVHSLICGSHTAVKISSLEAEPPHLAVQILDIIYQASVLAGHPHQVLLDLPDIDLKVGGQGDQALQLCLLPINCSLKSSQVIPL